MFVYSTIWSHILNISNIERRHFFWFVSVCSLKKKTKNNHQSFWLESALMLISWITVTDLIMSLWRWTITSTNFHTWNVCSRHYAFTDIHIERIRWWCLHMSAIIFYCYVFNKEMNAVAFESFPFTAPKRVTNIEIKQKFIVIFQAQSRFNILPQTFIHSLSEKRIGFWIFFAQNRQQNDCYTCFMTMIYQNDIIIILKSNTLSNRTWKCNGPNAK